MGDDQFAALISGGDAVEVESPVHGPGRRLEDDCPGFARVPVTADRDPVELPGAGVGEPRDVAGQDDVVDELVAAFG
ncbi:hypothetical protein D3C85_1807260 [compost metagenome]